MDSGEEVEAGSDVHQLMTAASERAMRITSRMNAEFNSLSDTREQLERLFMRPLPQGVGLFPPFTTDCGLNTHLGEGVFLNAGCRFQDQGGIYIGDRALIGHNCVIATLNHDMDPAKRANLIPAPRAHRRRRVARVERYRATRRDHRRGRGRGGGRGRDPRRRATHGGRRRSRQVDQGAVGRSLLRGDH